MSASLTNATGLGIANLTGGAVSQPWGAVAHSLIGFAFVFFGGYNTFEKFMKLLVGVMGFSILFCALFTLDDPSERPDGADYVFGGGRVEETAAYPELFVANGFVQTVAYPGGHPNARFPSTCTCKCGTLSPASGPLLITTR